MLNINAFVCNVYAQPTFFTYEIMVNVYYKSKIAVIPVNNKHNFCLSAHFIVMFLIF